MKKKPFPSSLSSSASASAGLSSRLECLSDAVGSTGGKIPHGTIGFSMPSGTPCSIQSWSWLSASPAASSHV
eukprot:5385841-Pyramimonas_sp.AAC.1